MENQNQGLGTAFRRFLEPWAYWANNPLTIAGVVLTTATAFTMIYSWVVYESRDISPYAGIILWMVLPAVFVIGLLLIPAGMIRRRLVAYRHGTVPVKFPPLDLSAPLYRRPLLIVMVMTAVNIAVLTTATYRGVHYMDSVQFCGQACHRVMEPEFVAYQNSAHSRVACVECHIGPGASWFVRSKLSGSYQVIATTLNTYPRPIPTPVENLRPARETCEQCHWPDKFAGSRLFVREHFADDEKNTLTRNVLLMRVGGRDPLSGKAIGIHGVHMAPGTVISYLATDEQRQTIPLVALNRGGEEEIFTEQGVQVTDQQKNAPRRVMDCMDCHNRPSHSFEMPEQALDRMMASGRISPELPFARKKALELLKAQYGSKDEALTKITDGFREFYRSSYPQIFGARANDVDHAAQAVAAIYRRNIFPQMRIEWGTYPNNIGHMTFTGCFRCHGGSHTSAKGNTITGDCTACHNMLATDEPTPKILQDLGLTE